MDVEMMIQQNNERPKVDVSFRDLNYSVFCGKQEKCLLKNISGKFKAGQISAILGPSGSGKTTLINILAGYKITKVSGEVLLNNKTRIRKQFQNISRYVTQENLLQPWLTIWESMMIAADFKLDFRVTKQEKEKMITDILKNLGLTDVGKSTTEQLSGGERKRLAIALELIDNSSILFLDEPTSGLDEHAGFQCVSTLKQLAEEGRTVICSIHSPSAKTFALFDHVYIITEGQCVYQGQGDQILSFLENIELTCPVYHNPLDFFIDIASGEYGQQLNKLVDLTQNGKLCYPYPNENDKETQICDENIVDTMPEYSTSTISQLKVLLYRSFLQFCRNTTELKIKFIIQGIILIIFSSVYFGCGNDATKIFETLTYLYLSIVITLYCNLMPPLIHFPVEIKIIHSEYFNRWYNIPAHFIAKSLAVIPGFIMFTILYVVVTYPLTDQPLAADRMIKFTIICVIVSMIADASALAIASVMNSVNAFFVGIAMIIPPIMLALYDFGYPFHFHSLMIKLIIRTSFLRYALEGLLEVVYDDRENLVCPETEVFCPITSPKLITKAFGYGTMSYWTCVAALMTVYVVCKCGHYLLLRQRLRPGSLWNKHR